MTKSFKMMAAALTTLIGSMELSPPVVAAELVNTHGAWKSYRHGSGDQRMCFVVSEPTDSEPKDAKRQSPRIYVTAWPAAGVRAEISVLVGAALKKGAVISIDIDGTQFDLFPDGDRAYVSDANDEQKLLEAMRRGRSMVITATPATGQSTRDAYSLSGVTAAIQSIGSICP